MVTPSFFLPIANLLQMVLNSSSEVCNAVFILIYGCQIAEEVRYRRGRVTVIWMKAHATADDIVLHGLTADMVIGNAVADALAKRGLALNDVLPHQIRHLEETENIARLVRQRLACINLAVSAAFPRRISNEAV